MPQPISNEKRADIIRHMKEGASKREVAKWLFVCERTVTRVWNKFRIEGSYEPRPANSGRKPVISDEAMGTVVDKIKEQPDITLLELIDELKLPMSESGLSRRLKRLGLTFKKRHFMLKRKNDLMLWKSGKYGEKTNPG